MVIQIDPSCQYRGSVVGSQGNFFTGHYTTGANRIGVIDDHRGLSAQDHGSTQTDMTYAGEAYPCNNIKPTLAP